MTFDWQQAATGLKTFAPSEPVTWTRVSKREPCPVCGHADWCGISLDGRLARCMRVVSGKPVTGGDGATGWIHRLGEETCISPATRRCYVPLPQRRLANFESHLDTYRSNTTGQAVARLAMQLGVTSGSLQRLGVCWAGPHRAWAFPMRDAAGAVVGIRLRNENGDKWSVSGSRQGLFYDPAMPRSEPVLICEGPTDTAAVLSIGFCAVGRPSCRGGGAFLADLLAGRRVVIVADRDEAKVRPDGSFWYPGQEGAADLADQLTRTCHSVKLVKPPEPHKDVRDWIFNGGTPKKLRFQISIAYEW